MKKNREAIIYKITHLKSGRIYIGQTYGTLKQKLWAIRSYRTELGKLRKEKGQDAFKIEILEKVYSQKICNQREKFYIKLLKSDDPIIGFNRTKGEARKDERKIIKTTMVTIRFPESLLVWLKQQATTNYRTMTGEIIHRLTASKKKES